MTNILSRSAENVKICQLQEETYRSLAQRFTPDIIETVAMLAQNREVGAAATFIRASNFGHKAVSASPG